NDHFEGASFDGRYVYGILADHPGTVSATLMRIDTTVPFGSAAVQMVPLLDVLGETVPAGGQFGYSGMAFDGQYLYFAPKAGNKPVRFLARTPDAPLGVDGGS